ncbi:UNVERIFIED_CONTAM: hypothetical protein Scaly_1266900 [Sesamum calycinum]|uniref:Uncharacterized protein n=1 Tax=Sesamum calycinum TaxID=2727403 RepID=A0AAW2Q5T6_9LAMI
MTSSNSRICFTLLCVFLIFFTRIQAASETGLKKPENKAAATSKRILQGSVPPSCTGQCGGCTPCNRVLVKVPPGDNYVWHAVNLPKFESKNVQKKAETADYGEVIVLPPPPQPPPNCTGKCRGCQPCVPVQRRGPKFPGTDYYRYICPAIATGKLDLLAELYGREEMVKWAGYGDEKLSTVLIDGKLLCRGSGGNDEAYPVSGATVGVFCGARGKAKQAWSKGSTDSYGEFVIDVPSHLHAIQT